MKQHLKNLAEAMEGEYAPNRTGVGTNFKLATMDDYYMADGFPAVTTKFLPFKMVVAEMLGFIRGYDNAADFRALGCNVWDANANDPGKPGFPNKWLTNPNRKGEDDLGRVYGVQGRNWRGPNGDEIDQFKKVIDHLSQGIDDRREIVTHMNPGEMDQMALPPCHMMYQFGLEGDKLTLLMYQRSCDLFLGVPFNVAGYAWLLHVVAKITNKIPHRFAHVMFNYHVYENHRDQTTEQLSRTPYNLPTLGMNPDIKTLEDLETWVTPDDFWLENYEHHPSIEAPMAV